MSVRVQIRVQPTFQVDGRELPEIDVDYNLEYGGYEDIDKAVAAAVRMVKVAHQ